MLLNFLQCIGHLPLLPSKELSGLKCQQRQRKPALYLLQCWVSAIFTPLCLLKHQVLFFRQKVVALLVCIMLITSEVKHHFLYLLVISFFCEFSIRVHGPFFFFFNFIYLFIYLWLCWVFVSVRGLSLVAASGGHSSSRCAGLSLPWPLLLRSTGTRRAGSAIVAHGPSCSAACGIFPDQGSNLYLLHWQANSQPLRHQGSPRGPFLKLGVHLLFNNF